MNLEEAIDLLKSRSFVTKIEKIPNRGRKERRWFVQMHKAFRLEFTDHEIIKEANKLMRSDSRIKGIVKYFGNRKNRHKTRQKIRQRRLQEIPQNKPVDRENPWNWD